METGVRAKLWVEEPWLHCKSLKKKPNKQKKTSRCPETLYINAKVDFFFLNIPFFLFLQLVFFFPVLFLFHVKLILRS